MEWCKHKHDKENEGYLFNSSIERKIKVQISKERRGKMKVVVLGFSNKIRNEFILRNEFVLVSLVLDGS